MPSSKAFGQGASPTSFHHFLSCETQFLVTPETWATGVWAPAGTDSGVAL
jgi:hypothetical protein